MSRCPQIASRMWCGTFFTLVLLSSITTAEEPQQTETTAVEVPQSKSVPAAEQLTKIVESMRDIETRLKDRNTGEATQQAQQTVLKQLDELLKAPPEPPPSGGGGGAPPPPPPSNSSNSKIKPSSGASGRQPEQGKAEGGEPNQARPQPAGKSGSQDRKNAEDAEERTGPNRNANTLAAKRQRLEVDVWGHLPEKLREQLLSSYGERMLPQYEEAVRRFYDQLAAPPATRPR